MWPNSDLKAKLGRIHLASCWHRKTNTVSVETNCDMRARIEHLLVGLTFVSFFKFKVKG